MYKVAFYGIEPELAQELRTALEHESIQIQPKHCANMDDMRLSTPDVVFSGFTADLANLLTAVTAPVVVVSRHPEANEYINAMEAGAADYCTAPFEPGQLRWLLKKGGE